MAKIKKPAAPMQSRTKRAAAQKATTKLTKAYGLLVQQPLTVAGLDPLARNNVVISAVMDGDRERVLSRYGDPAWELWPFVTTPNTQPARTRLEWRLIPEPYLEVCKAVVFRYWRVGAEGCDKPSAKTLFCLLRHFSQFFRFLEAAGISSLVDVHPIHIANYIHARKSAGNTAGTVGIKLRAIEKLYAFRDQHPEGLPFHPWPESSAGEVAGQCGRAREGCAKTRLIPVAISQALFTRAESILKAAHTLMDERDAGLRSPWQDQELLDIRTACFYLLGVLTGMRNSELCSIQVNAGRTESKNGYTFHWLASVEYKTKKGMVEYLMPAMGHDILRVMERWSEPHRAKLSLQLAAWEAEEGERDTKRLQQIANARTHCKMLFLGNGATPSGLVPLSDNTWNVHLKAFAKAAGLDWELTAHQMRRLYAYTFVRHRLGDLLFLKEQFKHSSINMTQLYAANPQQDTALYDEILEELRLYKIETITCWMEGDELLAGGAGKKIMALRAHDFPNREAMLKETAEKVTIRSTGHSWCLAQDEGCGGSGIYEKGRCGGCHNGLIDSRFKPFWQETYKHLTELLTEAGKLGPGAVKRVQRDLDEAARVLKDLGMELPQEVSDGNRATP